jgi:hypothetical protein
MPDLETLMLNFKARWPMQCYQRIESLALLHLMHPPAAIAEPSST